jgi:cbb3-type cytochrome oxidase subunit 3
MVHWAWVVVAAMGGAIALFTLIMMWGAVHDAAYHEGYKEGREEAGLLAEDDDEDKRAPFSVRY